MAGFVQAMHSNRKKRRGGKRATQEDAKKGKRMVDAAGPTGHKKSMTIKTED